MSKYVTNISSSIIYAEVDGIDQVLRKERGLRLSFFPFFQVSGIENTVQEGVDSYDGGVMFW